MSNLQFEVPYNNQRDTLEELLELKEHNGNTIREIYLNAPQHFSGSGRVMPGTSCKQLIDVIKLVHGFGVRINLLFNSTCEGAGWYQPETVNKTLEFIRLLHHEYELETVTIANPVYIRYIRKAFPDLEICSSVLADIDCLQKALIHRNAGADVIIPDVNINRNLGLLKKIKEATGAQLKLMVNEGCIHHCPWRKFQFNHISHQPKEILEKGDAIFNECQNVISKDPSQIFKSGWIRPEDLNKYAGITTHFKIVGRDKPKSYALRTVKAYMEESWDGDLLDILCASLNTYTMTNGVYVDNKKLESVSFFENVTECDQKCEDCSFCSKLAKEMVRYGVMTRAKLEDFGLKEMADKLDEQYIEEKANRY